VDNANARHIAVQDVDFDGNESLNHVHESVATGSLPTPAAGTEGELPYDSTVKQHVTITDADKIYVANANADATDYVRLPCMMHVGGLATPATANTTTEWGGWTLDATAEELICVATLPIPNGWTGANDLFLDIDFLLLNAETDGDDARFDGVWISVSNTDLASDARTETAFAAVDQDCSSGTQYDKYRVSLTIDHDDASNPVAVGDIFRATIFHAITGPATPVAGVIVVGAYVRVPVFNYDS
jgi:hypothetical protein